VTGSSEGFPASDQKTGGKAPSDAGRLPLDRVDVWVISLCEAPNRPDPARWLSADERARANRFVFERDRRRFCLGRGALRGILASYLRCDPGEIAFEYGESGKPRLRDGDAAMDLQFNASGSADLAVCVVTCGQNVGVDIEHLRDDCDQDLVRYAFSADERAEFARLPPDQQAVAFYRAWTRKEAYLKATGCGLSRPLASFSVSVALGDSPRLIRDDSDPAAHQNWSFADFDPAPGWVGSLVVAGHSRPLRRLEWNG
jgi:4'-phosphopantetheinyl transferase